MKRGWSRSIVMFLVSSGLLVLLACSVFPTTSPTPIPPTHYGAFLQKGDLAVKMEEYPGGPPSYDADGIPTTSESQPLVLLWHPDANLTLLVLADEERGGGLPYDATPRDGGVLEIRPKEPLDPGVYCLAQGSPILPPSLILHWCFYCDPEVATTPGQSKSTSAEEPPVVPPTVEDSQASDVGVGTILGELPQNYGCFATTSCSLQLLALSETFHPYHLCGMYWGRPRVLSSKRIEYWRRQRRERTVATALTTYLQGHHCW